MLLVGFTADQRWEFITISINLFFIEIGMSVDPHVIIPVFHFDCIDDRSKCFEEYFSLLQSRMSFLGGGFLCVKPFAIALCDNSFRSLTSNSVPYRLLFQVVECKTLVSP